MSLGEEQIAAPVLQEKGPVPVARRFLNRRTLFVAAILIAGLLAAWAWRDEGALSAEEARLVGTWKWTTSTPPKPGAPDDFVTFNADRTITFSNSTQIESRWRVVRGRLKITHYYEMTIYRDGPRLPMKKADPITWKLSFTENPTRINLTEGHHFAATPFDAVLTPSKAPGPAGPKAAQ